MYHPLFSFARLIPATDDGKTGVVRVHAAGERDMIS